ncbi:MAG TPA: DMT family transporter [Armatimonadota bacterium]|nr:DMT family transporter [Armatimonadota bacterium]
MTQRAQTGTDRSGAILDPVLLSVAVIWGANFPVYKSLMHYIAPTGLLAVRFVTMTSLLLVILWVTGRLRHNPRSMWLPLFLAGVLVMGTQQVSFVLGLNLTAAGEGSLLFSTAPVFTTLMVAAAGIERIGRGNWVGALVAFVGVAMVIMGGSSAQNAPHTRVVGDVLMLVSSLGYALFMVISKGLMERYGTLKALTVAYMFGALVVVPFGLPDVLAVDWGALPLVFWLCLFYIVVVSGVYGFAAWYWRISRTSPARVAVYQYIVPVVAMVTAAAWLGERPAAVQIAGALLVLAGLALARRRSRAACVD